MLESIILAIHDDQIRLYGVCDSTTLDSAIHVLRAQFGGNYLHLTLVSMAAAYSFHLSQNHPFVDGNKRVTGMSMFTFLRLNGLNPTATELDYYQTIMAVASGLMSKEQLTAWVQTIVGDE